MFDIQNVYVWIPNPREKVGSCRPRFYLKWGLVFAFKQRFCHLFQSMFSWTCEMTTRTHSCNPKNPDRGPSSKHYNIYRCIYIYIYTCSDKGTGKRWGDENEVNADRQWAELCTHARALFYCKAVGKWENSHGKSDKVLNKSTHTFYEFECSVLLQGSR